MFFNSKKTKQYSRSQSDDAIEATLMVVKIVGASILIIGGLMAFVL